MNVNCCCCCCYCPFIIVVSSVANSKTKNQIVKSSGLKKRYIYNCAMLYVCYSTSAKSMCSQLDCGITQNMLSLEHTHTHRQTKERLTCKHMSSEIFQRRNSAHTEYSYLYWRSIGMITLFSRFWVANLIQKKTVWKILLRLITAICVQRLILMLG